MNKLYMYFKCSENAVKGSLKKKTFNHLIFIYVTVKI